MAIIKEPQRVLPVIGFICIPGFEFDFLQELRADIGDVVLKSDAIPFKHTTYYNKEMGDDLLRQWYGFDKLVTPDVLAEIKIRTNEIEKRYVNKNGGREVNIDPGLISMSNLVLASTKNYSHRIYLGQGIYAEVTLIYRNQQFNPLEWTYPDYEEASTLEFFSRVRAVLKEKLSVPGRETRE